MARFVYSHTSYGDKAKMLDVSPQSLAWQEISASASRLFGAELETLKKQVTLER